MPTVCCLFRSGVTYRRDEFLYGLSLHGYTAVPTPKRNPERGDILLLWNRLPTDEHHATAYERAGGRVLVAENGYLSNRTAKSYAVAWTHHNGAGIWPHGGPGRFAAMNLELAPWRSDGDRLVVLAQRGIGTRGIAQPPGWVHGQLQALPGRTARPVVLRRHPGPIKTEPYDDLAGCHAAVTWASGAGIKALAAGVPVFHGLPRWIGAAAATPLDRADLEQPMMNDGARLAMFERLAWAQWSIAEIVSGEAFEWLLKN